MFIEILFKIVLFKGGVLIYAERCIYTRLNMSDIILINNIPIYTFEYE